MIPSNSNDRSLHTVGCGDLYEILADLTDRRLLGALELSREGEGNGYVNVSAEMTAAIITHVAAISKNESFPTAKLTFSDEKMTLAVHGVGKSAEDELARLARLGRLAGFESKYTDGKLELTATVRSTKTLKIYAVKPAWLRDLFEHFLKNKTAFPFYALNLQERAQKRIIT